MSDQERMDILFERPEAVPDVGQHVGLYCCTSAVRYLPVYVHPVSAGHHADIAERTGAWRGDIICVAARADKLLATHGQQSHDLVANMEVAEEQPAAQIAAVQRKEPK